MSKHSGLKCFWYFMGNWYFLWQTYIFTFCVCLKSTTLHNCLSSSFLDHFSGVTRNSNGEFGGKKYFIDLMTANTIQLFATMKGFFFWSILFRNIALQRGISQTLLAKCRHLFNCTVLKMTYSNGQKPV